VRLARVAIDGASGLGAAASGDGSFLELTDLAIDDTAAVDCPVSCGAALGSYASGTVAAERFAIDRSAQVGVQLDPGAAMTLVGGSIANAIVCADVPESVDQSELLSSVALSSCITPVTTAARPYPPLPTLPP
jgi:hypothetical protein